MKMTPEEIEEMLRQVRNKRDRMTLDIVSSLNKRSELCLNQSTFTEIFYDNKTWFDYRLFREQDLDSVFGRFEFPDQQSLISSGFKEDSFAKPVIKIEPEKTEVKPYKASPDIGSKIIDLYKNSLQELCQPGENRTQYGETTKLDVNNILLYNERVIGIGKFVAEAKIQQNSSVLYLPSDEEIRTAVQVPEVEERVISDALNIAEKIGLQKPELVKEFFKGIMKLTVDVEISYIKHMRPIEYAHQK